MSKQNTPVTTRRRTTPATRTSASARRPVGTRRRTQEGDQTDISWDFPLAKQNLIGIGVGLLLVVIGYMCMSTGMMPREEAANNAGVWDNSLAVTLAPILLVLGYCVVIPFSIIYRFNKGAQQTGVQETAGA